MEDGEGPKAERLQAALVRRFREGVERHLREHEALEAHCRRLGVTQTTLTRACRAVTGRSPLGLIHERLMAEARRMLIHGSRSVSDVAHELGFESAYFSRFFARHEGVPPAAYKRRNAS
jgi:AraC family transcriptional activator of pobA